VIKRIVSPNLPEGMVKAMLAPRGICSDALSELEKAGVRTVPAGQCGALPEPVAAHADMLFHQLSDSGAVIFGGNPELESNLADIGFTKILRADIPPESKYPHDIALDAARIGARLICDAKHTSKLITDYCDKNNIKVISVRQGYAKCSVCIVNENAIITSDAGIAAAAQREGIDVLMISSGSVMLRGYDYGFIGGCCGKLARDTMAFYGELGKHPDADSIRDFLWCYGVAAVPLKKGVLEDIGGLIPLTEEA
jgi:hypothetical protein